MTTDHAMSADIAHYEKCHKMWWWAKNAHSASNKHNNIIICTRAYFTDLNTVLRNCEN